MLALTEYAGFQIGEEVKYVCDGIRNGRIGMIQGITRHPLSTKSVVFSLIFDYDDLPRHLREQSVTFPQNARWMEKIEF